MTLRLHNTLTRRVEPFVPLQPGKVSLYTCGPTVYNYAHIGNFRTFLFEDLLRRWLEASGYDVFHIMNLTDVDDRTIAAAGAKGVSLRAHVDPFARAFEEDRDWLRIRPPHVQPRATEYIGPMIALIQGLLEKDVAYVGDDGSVYFAIARFPAYGRLSQLDRRELRPGASERVSADEYGKEDARDFVLWKAARPEDEAVGAAWDAPFGRGRPGWHVECSAMALELIRRHLGMEVLDIHAGGVDLIFPHHEDEIAQSCAYTGRDEFARVWLHGEFLNIRGEKMSKRFGNITTARDLREDGVDPGAVRLLMYQVHYRRQLDLTDEGLASAQEGSRRLGEFQNRLLASAGPVDAPSLLQAARRLEHELADALNDDLNAPRAVAAMFAFASSGNAALDAGETAGPEALAAWRRAEGVLGVTSTVQVTRVGAAVPLEAPDGRELTEAPPAGADEEAARAWAIRWAVRRKDAKMARDYAEADRIRGLLKSAGWEVRDNRDGSIEVVRTRG
jgi:cysteinyl-tRNA synthetase